MLSLQTQNMTTHIDLRPGMKVILDRKDIVVIQMPNDSLYKVFADREWWTMELMEAPYKSEITQIIQGELVLEKERNGSVEVYQTLLDGKKRIAYFAASGAMTSDGLMTMNF